MRNRRKGLDALSGQPLSLSRCDSSQGKHGGGKEELDADAFPVKAQVEDFLSEARQHIVGADVPVGGKETSYGKYGTGEHGLRDKDTAEKGHGQTDDICQHI